MALDVTIETTIAREPDVVFAHIADIEAWPRWLIASGITAVRRAGTGPLRPGERIAVDQLAAGRAGRFAAEVKTLEPPTRFAQATCPRTLPTFSKAGESLFPLADRPD